ncbi:MAG: hypothetical protein AYK18_13690 [Theionarchaea archaeon DG-70]|nr:MAG: hypothetical protein AYK18_13690 [Theionarchaea archaeon DG-70]
MKRFIFIFLVMGLLQCIPVAADSVTVVAPAVQKTPQGFQGVLSYITVVTQEGSGHIYIDTWPLAEVDIQGSARLAVQVACEVVNQDWKTYDFFITVRSDSPIIGGPSAGGAITVAVIAALQGWELRSDVVMSGTINPDETVGPVGGLYEKAQAASEVADLFLVPEGQTTIVVEETEQVQQGPFTYITTTQKEVDLEEEGRTMGLQVKEVYDIRDAVYYFTGKRIEPPQIEAKPIRTDFMKPYAQEKLEQIRKEYESAQSEIDSYTGAYKKDLETLLESAHEEIEYAGDTFDHRNYYTSMSASFVAGLYITYAVNLFSYFEGQPVEDIFEGLDSYLVHLSEEIQNERPYGMTALQCIAAAQKRIIEARDYLQEVEDGSDFDYIEYGSYAQRRGESAEFWLNLSRDYQEGDEIIELMLKNAASSMVNTAELSLVYASSILPQSNLLEEAAATLETAEKAFMEKAYAASLFSAVESKVYAEVSLIFYSSDRSVIAERVDRARERASSCIEESRKRGIEPVLAVSYYELAESRTNSIQSLIYLGYAEEIASIYRYIEAQPDTEIAEGGETQGLGSEIIPVTIGSEEGALFFLGIGVFVGIGVYWVLSRVLRR